MIRFKSLVFGLVLAVGATVTAQGPPGFKMPSLRYNPALLMNPTVQKDMHLSTEAGQKVQGVIMSEGMKMLPMMMGGMNGKKQTPAEQKKFLSELLAANNRMQTQVLKFLSPAQRTRLHEITLQQSGATALLDPAQAAEIGMSPKQSSALQAAVAKISIKSATSLKGLGPMMGRGANPDPSAMTRYAQSAAAVAKTSRIESDRALDAILTPSQKSKWLKIQGRHIELKGMAGMGGMFGGM